MNQSKSLTSIPRPSHGITLEEGEAGKMEQVLDLLRLWRPTLTSPHLTAG